jgi:hypothetical protein
MVQCASTRLLLAYWNGPPHVVRKVVPTRANFPLKVSEPVLRYVAFPYELDAPPEVAKPLLVPFVPRHISFELGYPELRSRFGRVCEATTHVAVPEAAVNEYHGPVTRKDDVGSSGQLTSVKPKAQSACVEVAPDRELRLRVPPPNAGHHPAPGFRVDDISH